MDSNSDWDSLSGDEELEPPSVSVAVESSRQIKQPPHVDPIEQHVSPSLAKSPLSRTNKEPRAPPRTSEKYRNTANREKGVTVFKDVGNIEPVSERSITSRKRREIPETTAQNNIDFQEIEMKEKIQNRTPKTSLAGKDKRATLMDANENLPYTEFEASDTPPRKMSTELVTRGAIQNKPKLEYVVQNPQQQEPAIKRQKEPARVVKQPLETSPKAAKKLQKPGRKKKGSERQEHPVIINENADSYLPEDTDVDYSWNERNYGIEEGNETGYGKIVVLKSAYENGRVEERYLYENAVRDYHSTFISKNAKLPQVAERVESYTQRGIQEFFGALQIVVDFAVIFIVELLRFLFRQFGRKLIGGTVTVFGDSFLKPVLTAVFNNVVQPLFVLVWNMMFGFRKLLDPVLAITKEILSQVSMVLQSFRLVEVNRSHDSSVQTV